MRTLALSDEILMKVDKAARYIGGEVNSVMKDKNDVDIRFACLLYTSGARTVKLPVPKSNVSPTEGYCTIIAFAVAVFIKLLNKFEVCT